MSDVFFTSWCRIEASTSVQEMEQGLQARIADPWWLLARQWQMGEFRGEDAASPVRAHVSLEKLRLERLRLHRADDDRLAKPKRETPVVVPLPDGPLESLVEREALAGPSALQRSIEAGTQLLARISAQHAGEPELQSALRAAFRAAYPLDVDTEKLAADLDPSSVRFLRVLSGRAVDGAQVRAAAEDAGPGNLPARLALTSAQADAARSILEAWTSWYDARFSEPAEESTAWLRERMEYSFDVSAPADEDELVLCAEEYHGGHLDWYAFDVSDETALEDTPVTRPVERVELDVLPTQLSYSGMPVNRFWEFEDTRVHLAKFTAAPAELSKTLLIEYAMVYGDDWFRIPVDLATGDLVRVDALQVYDNFGGVHFVKPATQETSEASQLRLFSMRGDRALGQGDPSTVDSSERQGPWLLRVPSVSHSLHSDALEEVVLARDEMANLSWGIERTVESATGRPLARAERWTAKRRIESTEETEPTESTDDADARYAIQSTIPDYWVPFVPVKLERSGSDEEDAIIFRRGRFVQPDGELSPLPKGRLLEPEGRLLVFEEELPSEGAVVSRRWQFARWHDGTSWMWVARRKQRGLGERSSGLRYDRIDPGLS